MYQHNTSLINNKSQIIIKTSMDLLLFHKNKMYISEKVFLRGFMYQR